LLFANEIFIYSFIRSFKYQNRNICECTLYGECRPISSGAVAQYIASTYIGITLLFYSNFFFYSHSSIRCVFYNASPPRPLYQLTAVRPAKQLLVLVSRLSLIVFAFADQMWTPTRTVASVEVSATLA